jgi:hypothetical protein
MLLKEFLIMKKCQNCEFARFSLSPDMVHCTFIDKERRKRSIDCQLGDIYNYAENYAMEQKYIRELEMDPNMCRSEEEFYSKFLNKELPDLKIYTGWAIPSKRIHSKENSNGLMLNEQYLTEKESVCKFYEESTDIIRKKEEIKSLFLLKK